MRRWVLSAVVLAGCSSGGESGGGMLMFDGGIGPMPGETCTGVTTCPAGKYEQCSKGTGTACETRYLAQDGTSFPCASCGDCQMALNKVAMWCQGQKPVDDSNCKTMRTTQCYNCCDAAHQDAVMVYNQLVIDCLCNSPGLCRQECRNEICQGQQATPFGNCDFCSQGELGQGGSCDNIATECLGDSTCAPLQMCTNTCP